MLSTIASLVETMAGKASAVRVAPAEGDGGQAPVRVTVVGAGGAGGNAVGRMIDGGVRGVRMLALNTDVQALSRLKRAHTFAIGPNTTGGMGSGGRPEIGRKAIKESQSQVAELLDGSDLVFVTSGMGGGTGTGAAPVVAETARRMGALTVGVVTMPFAFEGPERRAAAIEGVGQLRGKVDTLIAVENDRLLDAADGEMRLDRAFALADEVLRQGVQGISDLVTAPGLINVDFADLKALMKNGGPSYMALGEGRGRSATFDAARAALSNPLFDAPLNGAGGILLNVTGGEDLTLGQVNETADLVRQASGSDAGVLLGVVQDRRMKRRVKITLVATGLQPVWNDEAWPGGGREAADRARLPPLETAVRANGNGRGSLVHSMPGGH